MRVNTGSGIDPKLVEQLIQMERQPIRQVEQRKKGLQEEQKQIRELTGHMSQLGTSLNQLRNRSDFVKLKLESSHPDIVDGQVTNAAVVGSYEMEIRHLARTEKLLAEAFPDKDQTPVGFGYMLIEREDGSTFEVEVDPDKNTLQDIVIQINEAGAGVKAMVLNTKENLEDPDLETYRLLVISEKSGKAAKVRIDPDTTYLDFKEQVTGRNLEALFEDVEVYDDDNTLEDLVPGLILDAKRAEPGTKVTLNVTYDVDATFESIKTFVENYNKVNDYVDKQFQVDPETNRAGILSKDNTLRNLRRALQAPLQHSFPHAKPFTNLFDIGITTDPKNGALKINEAQVKKSLSENYLAVANLFVYSDEGPGLGSQMSDAVRSIQNVESGFLSSKDRELQRIMRSIDRDIQAKERLVAQKADTIKRRFSALEQLISGLNAQGQYLQARLGTPQMAQTQIEAGGGGGTSP